MKLQFNWGAALGLVFGIGAVILAILDNDKFPLFLFAAIFFVVASHLGHHKKKKK
ncbi:MAG: hypothetical protein KKA79_10795 [Nanoarchaeota archaeon]|nr:hypothetical protein [Nanoarchaeota archaeon]MCG2717417.1 hypothetical protein [Nanoarchaeota archaeon]